MNTEEKAKRYSEALKRAMELQEKSNGMILKKWLWKIFPELAEPSDERTRKALLHLVNSNKELSFGIDNYDGVKWEDIIAWLKKQGMLTDKPKPKFKVGDFIVNDYCRGMVVELADDAYLLDTEQAIPFSCEHNIHLWTIQDAEAGDVLAVEPIKNCSNSVIAIYKERGLNFFNSYCFVSLDGEFNKGTTGHDIYLIHPATKEQRDTLFQKMREAGYEWDAEKKELRKIDTELTDFEKSLKHIMLETLECGDMHNLKADAEMLLRLAQNPAEWSEEDEIKIKSIIAFLKSPSLCAMDGNKGIIDENIKYLKSLKDRVQPKQEWSEEDMQYLEDTLTLLEGNRSVHTYREVKNWLKSLKDRRQWKPSNDQMTALKEVCDKHWEPDGLDPLHTLYEELKKLKGGKA